MTHVRDLFGEIRSPVLAAWGAGWDSTAMLIEMIENCEPVDAVLFADTGSEKPGTYAFLSVFIAWLTARGVPCQVVRYEPKDFKNWPPYRTLEENCLTNGTLPSKAFGFGSCSQKWKVQPQDKWADSWEPARRVWAASGKVTKLIGYDCSPADQARYAHREGYDDSRYEYRYPLREWGWKREQCRARILAAGLPLPPKSACFFCPASKPAELHELEPQLLRRIVLMEARAKPRLRNVEGLWRKSVAGHRGATPKPGAMTDYIREQKLLPADEIDAIIAIAPAALMRWQEGVAGAASKPDLRVWLDMFDACGSDLFRLDGIPDLYAAGLQHLAIK